MTDRTVQIGDRIELLDGRWGRVCGIYGSNPPRFMLKLEGEDVLRWVDAAQCLRMSDQYAEFHEAAQHIAKDYTNSEQDEYCLAAEIAAFARRKIKEHLDTPMTREFLPAVTNEAAHQRSRWGLENDKAKSPEDWFWLVGYLAGKALHDIRRKRQHHIIATAAVLLNWLESDRRNRMEVKVVHG